MTTSIIVPTHNRHGALAALLNDLSRQDSRHSIEVLVVDSDEGESPQTIVDKFAAKGMNVKLLIAPNALSAKRNAGAANAAGSTLLFLDDDMRVPPNFVRSHEQAQQRPGVVVSSQIVFPRKWINRSNYYRYKNARHFNEYSGRSAPETLAPNNYVAMAFSISADDYHRIGGTDEDFQLYGGEDVEFGFRSARQGLTHVYAPDALAVHEEVDMDAYAFAAKVYKASYYGQALVLDKAPEATQVRTFRLLEPRLRETPAEKAAGTALDLLATAPLLRALLRILHATDRHRALHMPALYNAALLLASELGIKDRDANRPDRSGTIKAKKR